MFDLRQAFWPNSGKADFIGAGAQGPRTGVGPSSNPNHDRLVDHAEFDEDTWDHLLDQWLEASFQIARACDERLRRPKRWRAARLARANTMFDFAVLMLEGNL